MFSILKLLFYKDIKKQICSVFREGIRNSENLGDFSEDTGSKVRFFTYETISFPVCSFPCQIIKIITNFIFTGNKGFFDKCVAIILSPFYVLYVEWKFKAFDLFK